MRKKSNQRKTCLHLHLLSYKCPSFSGSWNTSSTFEYTQMQTIYSEIPSHSRQIPLIPMTTSRSHNLKSPLLPRHPTLHPGSQSILKRIHTINRCPILAKSLTTRRLLMLMRMRRGVISSLLRWWRTKLWRWRCTILSWHRNPHRRYGNGRAPSLHLLYWWGR